MGVINGVTQPPFFNDYLAIGTPFGLLTSPCSRVAAYVLSGGIWDGAPSEIRNALVTTLDAGLAKCRAGYQDIVYALPGHAENVTATTCILANQVAGAQVIGLGNGSYRPTFTFTATASQWNVTVSNMRFSNLAFVAAANGITKAILFTGTDNTMDNCDFLCATSAALYALIPVEVAAAAHRTTIARNVFRTTGATGAITEVINVAGASDLTKIIQNEFLVANATSLVINVAAAVATNLVIANNQIAVTAATAAAVGVIILGAAAMTGYVCSNYIYNVVAGNAFSGGITLGAGVLVGLWDNRNADEVVKSAVLTPAVGT